MLIRIAVFVAALLIGAVVFLQTADPKSTVNVTDARATPMGTSEAMFMVSATLQNTGAAVALTGIESPSGDSVSLMNNGQMGPMVIPQDGQGLLAMDGAHIMLSVPDGAFAEGAFRTITLTFSDDSKVVTRVMRPQQTADMAMMDHGMGNGVEAENPPTIAIRQLSDSDREGFDVTLTVENFTFMRAADDAAHVPNQGHAHIYLNGLKLGRLYEPEFAIGALLPGDYHLRIGLNTNDHRPYIKDGAHIEAVLAFSVP